MVPVAVVDNAKQSARRLRLVIEPGQGKRPLGSGPEQAGMQELNAGKYVGCSRVVAATAQDADIESLQSLSRLFRHAYEQAAPGVVLIQTVSQRTTQGRRLPPSHPDIGGSGSGTVVSRDGYVWQRGADDANLSLAPGDAEWERQMVEYPVLLRLEDYWRLFYCGNGYGKSGIGTAVSPA